jgi:DNA-binding NarL/FixJ family response regulator
VALPQHAPDGLRELYERGELPIKTMAFDAGLSGDQLKRLAHREGWKRPRHRRFSGREIEVIRHGLSTGRCSREIGRELGRSASAIRSVAHRRQLAKASDNSGDGRGCTDGC